MRFSMVRLACLCLPLFLGLGMSACSDPSSEGASSGGGCAWNGNCSTTAPAGAYDCLGNALVQCLGGTWEEVAYCPGFFEGNRSCTCKGGCGVDYTECSYAFEVCGGQRYETCGPNATSELNERWECVPDG